jgi:hypothetical protein
VIRWTKLDLTYICFLKKIKLTHCYFKSSPSIYSNWIDSVFFIFWASKIYVSTIGVVSSLFLPRYRLSSSWRRHATAPCHTSFPWSQDELAASISSFNNSLSCRLLSWVETEALNLHHRRRPSSLNSPTPTTTAIKKSSQSWSPSPPLNWISILPPH